MPKKPTSPSNQPNIKSRPNPDGIFLFVGAGANSFHYPLAPIRLQASARLWRVEQDSMVQIWLNREAPF